MPRPRKKQIAFLSANNLEDYVIDDHLSYEPLQELGWETKTISWRGKEIDWSQFACAIVRSTWDYQKDLATFLATLEKISTATRLLNPLPLLRWNADKIYLRELGQRGARIVPTFWGERALRPNDILRWCHELGCEELVIKPTVSANAEKTIRLGPADFPSAPIQIFAGLVYMVQPFMNGIVEEGEFSLFYFGGEYSHAILKTPKPRDFRVQEEHGGLIQAAEPSAKLLRASEEVMRLLDETPLYARVDFVRDQHGEFALMELELIEPSLYLRTDAKAPHRFAVAIDRWLTAAR